MKRTLSIAILLISYFNSYSQITFEKGYFINNEGVKTECLIKNIDWDNNPKKIQYKTTEDSESKIADLKEINEFQVSNLKYKKYVVDIDTSSNRTGELSESRNPHFKKDTLLIKVLIEGKANLYQYKDNSKIRYFYEIDSSGVQQLVYKRYNLKFDKIAENKSYKQQLLNNLKCESLTNKDVKSVGYKKRI